MAYIFMDESGDLGFNFKKAKTSKNFIITFLFVAEKWSLEKIVKKTFKWFSKIPAKKHSWVLHCYKEHPTTKMKLLKHLNEKDVHIMTIYLNKNKVHTDLQDTKTVLYNFVTNILLDRIFTKKLIPVGEKIVLIASRRETNKFLNQNFKDYLKHKTNINHKLKISIEIKTPSEEKCLQIVDFVCWSIFQKYEKWDESYYNMFKDKIIEENWLYK